MLRQLLKELRLKIKNKSGKDDPTKFKIVKFGIFYIVIVNSKFYCNDKTFRAWHLPDDHDMNVLNEERLF
jgi:hypothetical protein